MKILVLGDSHSVYFKITNELLDIHESLKGIDIKVVLLHGATINGFGKRKSTLDVQQKLLEEFHSYKPDYVCFALGQVDIELGIYYKKIIKNQDISEFHYIFDLCEKYIFTINNLITELGVSPDTVCIKGINLSVLTNSRKKAIQYTKRIITENIEDKGSISKYQKILEEKFPSNLERYNNHIYFNKTIKSMALGKFKYFDINEVIESKETKGTVAQIFIPAKTDHHILDSLFIRKEHLYKLLSTLLDI